MIQVKAAILGKKTGYNEGKQIGEEDKILKTAHRLLYTKYPPYDHTVIGKLNVVRYPQKMIFWSSSPKRIYPPVVNITINYFKLFLHMFVVVH
jgi:hypothetical protein